jgi:predicted short-subunit dehydrogenase-like oxidoreductase (DUF2520 family)
MIPRAVVVVGAGRVGLSLARALLRLAEPVRLLGRTGRPASAETPAVEVDWTDALASATLLVIAVADDALGPVVQTVAASRALRPDTVVLHTSGRHDRSMLEPLAMLGAVTGSWHPLQSIPEAADGTVFTNVPAVLEGEGGAVTAARRLAEQLGMSPIVELPAAGKVRYHAAAVVAANYLVVLDAIAERLAREAGAGEASRGLFLPIMRQVLDNLATRTPIEALTGPVRRGDVGTVSAHLAVLEGADREAYLVLAREALRLAEKGGLDLHQAAAIRAVLQ